ncbi:ABC transporter ATP-binding protein [Hydrogenimonas urashimensis]|uniref:ABC transporter ATP-binding protein n=1 Tax=Hydrogenimonas urashimensis TaxID=2740515 RepID=UPI001F3472DB|nr:ABC transporter ATP-binding protein [Hydrogenimonas urashimensis]
MLIECRRLVKSFRTGDIETDVLKGIDLRIEEGEFVAVMGSSGSGKSTLLYLLGCLDRPTSGTYLLNGEDVSRFDDDRLSHIRNEMFGFIFQSFYLIPYLNVADNVMIPTLYARRPRKKSDAMALLKKLQLQERASYMPDQLSGGQKQRAAIARALINDPKIIFADEPTGQLDSENARIVMETLKKLNAEGKTIVLVTHDATMAAYAKRTVRIRDGRILSA